MPDIKQGLIAVRELLADPARWTQEVVARTSLGEEVDARDPEAVCWCLYGACKKVGGAYFTDIVSNAVPGISIGMFNDTSTHEEVLAFLNQEISKCQSN